VDRRIVLDYDAMRPHREAPQPEQARRTTSLEPRLGSLRVNPPTLHRGRVPANTKDARADEPGTPPPRTTRPKPQRPILILGRVVAKRAPFPHGPSTARPGFPRPPPRFGFRAALRSPRHTGSKPANASPSASFRACLKTPANRPASMSRSNWPAMYAGVTS